ncbi:long-chain-alcohol O-fatty-acyltransferase-like [Impatiens glandulifera]|uniref:long-chain-alcohol O-fatty-acyltransferase-like n=1 Tax=Impatiens glandulifera TaxID=253017 RepID=UPI001FB146C9|nr:long-chain-alcohol O-fatty-acyltransferase-like [Impatiens glandulifera]
MHLNMDNEIQSFFKVCISSMAALCYCYFLVSRLHNPLTKLFFLLPIFYLFTILPLTLHSFHLNGPMTFNLTWLGNFKLLLFAFNQPPLFHLSPPNPNKSLLHFISVGLLPIKIEDPFQRSKNPSKVESIFKKWADLSIKFLLFSAVIEAYKYRPYLHPHVSLCIYCLHLYFGIQLTLALTAVPVMMILGNDLQPQFNQPYKSTSLQDFWGRRWNLVVTGILRPTVYIPVRRYTSRFIGRKWATATAVFATFLVSGLMHEVMNYNFSRAPPTWEMTWFFVLHGICTEVEVEVKKVVAGRWRLPELVSGMMTCLFLAVTGNWLFFPQMLRNGVDNKALEEYPVMVNFVKDKIQFLLSFICFW